MIKIITHIVRSAVVVAAFSTAVAAVAMDAPQAVAPAAQTMKAVRIHAYGGPEVLRFEDAPKPVPAAGEALIRVRAAGVNPVDWKIREGMMKGTQTLPFIVGYDIAGTIEAVAADVTDWKVGDEVCGYISVMRGGGYAQFACIPAKDLAKKPSSIDVTTAASVPLAALTAWQALFDKADLKPGQTVLIHGAAGGVGHFAVQLAKAKGAKVIATASAANIDFVKGLGADQVIDYRAQKFEEVVKDVDVVFDMIGGETAERSCAVLKEGGFLVSIVGPPPAERLAARKAKGAVFLVQPNGKELAEIMELISAGKVKPVVSATFPLSEAAKAHEKSKSGVDRGKIVLTVS